MTGLRMSIEQIKSYESHQETTIVFLMGVPVLPSYIFGKYGIPQRTFAV